MLYVKHYSVKKKIMENNDIMATLYIRIYTWIFGKYIGQDRFGNTYYTEKNYQNKSNIKRWVIYNGIVESSKIPAEWHGWLHYTLDKPLSEDIKNRYDWQKNHLPNLTGTKLAYSPKKNNTTLRSHYKAWTPK